MHPERKIPLSTLQKRFFYLPKMGIQIFMERHRNKKYHKNRSDKKNTSRNNRDDYARQHMESKQNTPPKRFHFVSHENIEAMAKQDAAIREFKARQVVCPKCGKIIDDLASAISDKDSGIPIHFECAMEELSKKESVGPNERICYIGQGRFGVLYFENPHDQKHFSIRKIIEWEAHDKTFEWRNEMSGLYSQVN